MTNLEIYTLKEHAKLLQAKIDNKELHGEDLLEALTFTNYVHKLHAVTTEDI